MTVSKWRTCCLRVRNPFTSDIFCSLWPASDYIEPPKPMGRLPRNLLYPDLAAVVMETSLPWKTLSKLPEMLVADQMYISKFFISLLIGKAGSCF